MYTGPNVITMVMAIVVMARLGLLDWWVCCPCRSFLWPSVTLAKVIHDLYETDSSRGSPRFRQGARKSLGVRVIRAYAQEEAEIRVSTSPTASTLLATSNSFVLGHVHAFAAGAHRLFLF